MSRALIEHTVIRLLTREPFYGHFFLGTKVQESTRVPTAGINVKDGIVQLYINPAFWGKLSDEARVALLKHEALHALDTHLIRFSVNPQTNIAMDTAINQLIPELKALDDCGIQGWTPTRLAKALNLKPEDVAKGQSAEYYYGLIQREAPQLGQGEGNGSLDDHTVWEEGASPEVAGATIKQLAQAAQAKAGSVSQELQNLLDQLFKAGLNWKVILRRFVANAQEFVSYTTRHRRNRRYGLLYPGWKSESLLHLLVITDSSGSVGDDEYAAFMNEIELLSKAGAVVDWCQADSEVKSVERFKPKQERVRKGYGGTAYGPALKKARELKVDAVVYFGDMDAADTPENPGMPVLWATVRDGRPPGAFGSVVKVVV